MGERDPEIKLDTRALGFAMPMYICLDPQDVIQAMGPTVMKVVGGPSALGHRLTDCFYVGQAGCTTETTATMQLTATRRIHLTPRGWPQIGLRGCAITTVDQGILLNLTFGVHLSEAIRIFELTQADFASSDMAMELLYLQEAKTAVLNEFAALNQRLDDARRSALDAAHTDTLTGLSNRRAFDLALEQSLSETRRGGAAFALAHLDLDHFKVVNDTLGHAAGDQVLANVAQILREETRGRDVVCRVGGDEFVLLLHEAIDLNRLEAMGQRIIARLERPLDIAGQRCRISGSIGISVSQHYAALSGAVMMADADAALYQAKREGRARCRFAIGDLAHKDVNEPDLEAQGATLVSRVSGGF